MSTSSLTTISSIESISSTGIGDNITNLRIANEANLPKLMPEGTTGTTDAVYDCIVYLIYCSEHDQIAVTNVDKVRCVWLPFVVMPEGVTWLQASHDGVGTLIGRQDAEMDEEEAEKTAPVYQMSYLHMLRIQLPSRRMILRLTQFVHLDKSEYFSCCQNNDRVNWIPSHDILNNNIDKVWGPELKILTSMLVSAQPQIINEFTLSNTLYYLYLAGSPEQKVLQSLSMTEQLVFDIYIDYVEHCYPSFYMCFESFRAYLIKYGYQNDNCKLRKLFLAFATSKRPFIDFYEFLIGLLIMEPKSCNNLESRNYFVFTYYDSSHKGYLDKANVHIMLQDIYPALSNSVIETHVQTVLRKAGTDSITWHVFSTLTVLTSKIVNLCRMPKSVLSQIAIQVNNRNARKQSSIAAHNGSRTKRNNTGTCQSCRVQEYDYANHLVTINTLGRCIDPHIISKSWLNIADFEGKAINRNRYSMEYVFNISSVPNIFIDLIRDFYVRPNKQKGLMCSVEEWHIFLRYLSLLCKEFDGIVANEDKLVKLNAPAIVFGDIQGSLYDLMRLQSYFYESFPICPEKLVFLGNYSGQHPYGVECLIYLFAMKICSPQKVFVLRGLNECGGYQQPLYKECVAKYGDNNGRKVHSIFSNSFAKLPLAAIVDENILCVHSGIPTTVRMRLLSRLPGDIQNPETEAPMAHEIITRVPQIGRTILKKGSPDSIHQVCQSSAPRHAFNKGSVNKTKVFRPKKKISSGVSVPQPKMSYGKAHSWKYKGKLTGKSHPNHKSMKSIKSIKSTKSKVSYSISPTTRFKRIADRKLKPQFLHKANRVSRKITMKNPPEKKVARTQSANRPQVYEHIEFVDFMKANDFDFLIRSQTLCPNGYRTDFENKCLTIYSASKHHCVSQNNEAAVALIDSSDYSIRFVRFGGQHSDSGAGINNASTNNPINGRTQANNAKANNANNEITIRYKQ